MTRIAIYDDSRDRRESLQAFLSLSPELEHVGSFENCANIESDITIAQPDIILMDIEMPEVNGLEGVRLAKLHFPQVKIIMQTAFDDDDKVFAAIRAGAEGYILKSASVNQIMQSIDDVINGGAGMSPSIALKVIRFFGQPSVEIKADYKLTAKENEVLKYLSDGHSYKMVADKMGISYFTVNNHVKKIYEKLHVHSLSEAMALAHKKGLV